MRALARLACRVTEAPWTLGAADLSLARGAGLSDETTVQVVLLASLFGHFNRIADAVGIELDYDVQLRPPHAEPATPDYLQPEPAEWPTSTSASWAESALTMELRPGAVQLLAAWRSHTLLRPTPLSRHQRSLISRTVGRCLGDAAAVHTQGGAPSSALEAALVTTACEVVRAPWRLGANTVARLRGAGLQTDAQIFDAIATASSCVTFSRITVALAALNQPRR